MHRRCADVTGLSALHHIMQRLERFLDRRAVVPAMDLIQIDIVGAEPTQAVVDFGKDRLA